MENVSLQPQSPLPPVQPVVPSPPPSSPNETQNKHFLKRLFELDIAMHAVTLILVVLIAYVFFSSVSHEKVNSQQKKQEMLKSQATKYVQMMADTKPPTTRRVYANTAPVDAEKVFSIPVANTSLAISGVPKKEVYAFFPYWMLSVEDKVNLSGLTTIGLFGLEINGQGDIVTVYPDGDSDGGWQMWNDPLLNTFINRVRARKIKLELTIKAFNNTNIEKLVLSDEAQKKAIANIIQLINLKSLDGVNLDFEYVGTPPKIVRDGFTRFVINLNTTMHQQISGATLTLCTYASAGVAPGIFDLPALSPYVDAFVIMGYDFHTPQGSPGPVAPMEGEVSLLSYVNAYLDKVEPEKIILAIPYYGYDWQVGSKDRERAKVLTYVELANATRNTTLYWDDVSQTPWYRYVDPETKATREVHFENTRSLGIKYDYINRKNLKGVGIWALGFDGMSTDLRQLILEKF